MPYFEILCGVAVLLLPLYYYLKSVYRFWENRGVSGPQPIFCIKSTIKLLLAKLSSAQFSKDIYDTYKDEPMIGLYISKSPILILKDPELIKTVLIRDFSSFTDRGLNVHERTEPMSLNLLMLDPVRWRPLRSKLSPMFTSGKLKEMFGLILECADHFEQYLNKIVAKGGPIDCREITAKFTTDVIGSCAFGLDMSVFEDEDSEFRRIGRQIFGVDLENVIRLKLRLHVPKIYDLLGFIAPDRRFAPFFTKVVADTMKYRKENNIVRPDFINMMMELRDHPQKLGDLKLTDTLITAQAFVFFSAGFETSSTTMSNTLYELALNQEIQDKLRKEIVEHLAKHNGKLEYEHIRDMEYLDKVFKETLRKYPPGAIIPRRTVTEYTFQDTKVTIPKQSIVWIPVYAIHRDSDIYPNPDVFDPERFNEEAIEARHPMNYLPFGDGPRNCIGARFAIYQTKIGLITILRNHKVDVCEKTMDSYQLDAATFLLAPKGGIHLNLSKIQN
ncbi:unnamed protein product [Xylocopa violacea]|uniref:Cytochrome P450 n=1 Tax=Xylocopa violacea TaxID=135666 RepID=A0ABP1PDN7_XYLVO